jgi:glycosyltransferase involved in cell wall biosynthesis
MQTVSVLNNTKAIKHLTGTGIYLPSKQWTSIPYQLAVKYQRDPGIVVDWLSLDNALDWEGSARHINLATPFDPHEGYGLMGNYILRALESKGIVTHISNDVAWQRDESRRDVFLQNILNRNKTVTRWGITHAWAPDFGDACASHRIGWSMWESTRLPHKWELFLELVERMIVPSKGQIQVFRNSGFKGPIDVIPDAVDFDAFTYLERPERDPFTFITWGRLSSRKCPMDLIECFMKAFPEDDVRLILKTREHMLGGGQIIPTIKDSRITVIDEEWSLSQVVDLCYKADAAVFLSHGEGFGQPAVQAMATGLPVILSNHSGQSDFCNEKYNYPVRTAGTVPGSMGTGHGDKLDWWESDYEHAMKRMREVYENRAKAREKGRKASVYVRKQFSLDALAERLAKLVWSLE